MLAHLLRRWTSNNELTLFQSLVFVGVLRGSSWRVVLVYSIRRLQLSNYKITIVSNKIFMARWIQELTYIFVFSNSSLWEVAPALTADCNSGCSCNDQVYKPFCGPDQLSYYNPCYAGCHTDYSSQVRLYLFIYLSIYFHAK